MLNANAIQFNFPPFSDCQYWSTASQRVASLFPKNAAQYSVRTHFRHISLHFPGMHAWLIKAYPYPRCEMRCRLRVSSKWWSAFVHLASPAAKKWNAINLARLTLAATATPAATSTAAACVCEAKRKRQLITKLLTARGQQQRESARRVSRLGYHPLPLPPYLPLPLLIS